jgi:NAD(P)-dependent dehydrogenase (short-subunit alcohol dehydrogenase family)
VFGAVATIKAVLPFMRLRRAGHVIAMSSMSGLQTVPGVGFYIGSKYALEGIVESLAKEVEHLGIRVTAVEPGLFRTEWAGRSMVRAESSLADYQELFAPLRAARLAANGHQPGDPDRAARVILQLIDARAEVDGELHAFEQLSRSTDFPDAA